MDMVNDGYRQLASSVINVAMSDRKDALMKLEKNPKDKKAKILLDDCDVFFKSEWCALLLAYLDIERDKLLEAVYGR